MNKSWQQILGDSNGGRLPIQMSGPPNMQCQMVASCNACACLAFSDADIEFDFVLMTSAYNQHSIRLEGQL